MPEVPGDSAFSVHPLNSLESLPRLLLPQCPQFQSSAFFPVPSINPTRLPYTQTMALSCPPSHPPKLSFKDLLTPATKFPISDCEPSPPQGQMDSSFIYPEKHGLQKDKKPIGVLLCPKKPKQSRRQEATPAILPSRRPSKVRSRQWRRAAGKEGWRWRGEL